MQAVKRRAAEAGGVDPAETMQYSAAYAVSLRGAAPGAEFGRRPSWGGARERSRGAPCRRGGKRAHRGPRQRRTEPRMPPEEKDFCDRMLIDATRPVTWKPRGLWGYDGVERGRPLRFPPSTKPSTLLARQVNDEWRRYGITPAPCYNGRPAGMMQSWWESDVIQQYIDGRMDP